MTSTILANAAQVDIWILVVPAIIMTFAIVGAVRDRLGI